MEGITAEQREFIRIGKFTEGLELSGVEVFAIFSLGQMNNRVVKCDNDITMSTIIAVFKIEELNGKSDLDFSNPDDWREVHIDSITVSLEYPDFEFDGSSKTQFSNLAFINSITLLS